MSTTPSENSVSTFARVDPETLEVTLSYNTNGGDAWDSGDLPCSIPFDVLSNVATLVDGTITLQADPTKVASKTQAQWTSLRAQRNQLLAASDWTQGNDSPLSTDSKSAWATYRQALRNLPDVTTDPLNPVWPSVPS